MADEYEYEPPVTEQEASDVELITRYLNGQLDFAEAAQVQDRLETDPAFFEFAEPLIIAWSVPAPWQREPVDQKELERQWDRFTKAAGFAHQKRKARRRNWLIGIALAFLLPFLAMMAIPATLFMNRSSSSPPVILPDDQSEFQLSKGVRVYLPKGSELDELSPSYAVGTRARLLGTATFTMDTAVTMIPRPLIVETANGHVSTLRAKFSVRVSGDTTEVRVIDRGAAMHFSNGRRVATLELVTISSLRAAQSVTLAPGDVGRLYRDGRAERVSPARAAGDSAGRAP